MSTCLFQKLSRYIFVSAKFTEKWLVVTQPFIHYTVAYEHKLMELFKISLKKNHTVIVDVQCSSIFHNDYDKYRMWAVFLYTVPYSEYCHHFSLSHSAKK